MPDTDSQPGAPRTPVLDGARLVQLRATVRAGDPALAAKLSSLRAAADAWLAQGPWTVTAQQMLPPSGDVHDYASQAPYWWAVPSPDGAPTYEQRDGEPNPEVFKYTAKADGKRMMAAAPALALAWWLGGGEAHARHAAAVLRAWFVSPETRMSPHLAHAQIVPGRNTGRAIGIIDFSQSYTGLLDAAAILEAGAPGWTADDAQGFRRWNGDFLRWLDASEFGVEESAEPNNHGTFAGMQKAALALFVGDAEMARREVELVRQRIDAQIRPDGAQPHELGRTRSWHYSTFNLMAFCRAACVGRKVGVDLWAHVGPEGQSLRAAVRFLLPAATGREMWGYPELDFKAFAAYDVVHAAADSGMEEANAALPLLEQPPGGGLYELRPAPEQLDAVTAG